MVNLEQFFGLAQESNSVELAEFADALGAWLDHAHIMVNIGESEDSARLNGLLACLPDVLNVFLPMVVSDRSHVMDWRDEARAHGEGNAELAHTTWGRLSREIPSLQQRYSDFPQVVEAMGRLMALAPYAATIRQSFREMFSPEELENLAHQLSHATFRTEQVVTHSSLAGAAEMRHLQQVRAAIYSQVVMG